jgi:hypothetical protein
MPGLPTLPELLQPLAFLGEQPAAVATLLTALIMIIIEDWRWSLFALAAQYILAGWLLTNALETQVAALKVLVGMMICLVLYITARQIDSSRGTAQACGGKPRFARMGLPFRLLIGLLTSIVVLYVTSNGTVRLPVVPEHVNLAAVGLMTMGLLALGLNEEPLAAGMGLLTAITGFELFYHSLEQAVTVIGFVVALDFLIATVTAYLTVAHHWTPEDAERGKLT